MGAMQRTAVEEEGQTMAEYGLILAGIAVVVMATVFLLGGAINTTFTDILNQF
ncbi:MAG: Flp family type IVb pilin [Dehalococcoidia bacterium]|nr:MAG: Flp family type IVb pilin [Dehalococcoidia bacterium]